MGIGADFGAQIFAIGEKLGSGFAPGVSESMQWTVLVVLDHLW